MGWIELLEMPGVCEKARAHFTFLNFQLFFKPVKL